MTSTVRCEHEVKPTVRCEVASKSCIELYRESSSELRNEEASMRANLMFPIFNASTAMISHRSG